MQEAIKRRAISNNKISFMPHLRMFLGGQQLDEVVIPEALLQNFSLNHLIEQEKQKLVEKHTAKIRKAEQVPSFVLEYLPSRINEFKSLQTKKQI